MLNLLAKATFKTLNALDRPAPPPTKMAKKPRGIALLISLLTITLVSASVIEFSYSNRVNMALGANERDQLKAYFLAKSAVNITKLLLSFQFALQSESRETEDDMGRLIGRAMRRSNFQIYQYVDLLLGPFNSGKIESPVGGINLSQTGVEGFGDFTGEMTARAVPEEGRFDINVFAKAAIDEGDLSQFCAMILDEQYNDLFELNDENGEILDRARVMQYIIDYMDLDKEGITLSQACSIEDQGGDEMRPYLDDRRRKPRNAKLTHPAELFQVHGIGDPFMRAFEEQLTVYNVGKPNINVAQAPVFYSVLCRSVQLEGASNALDACALNPQIGLQVMWMAMALDGIRAFFENPLSVLLAYVGSSESKLMPSAKKGQPVAFLSVSQLPAYIEDLKNDPLLMAQFLPYSPMYQALAVTNPAFAIDPTAPTLPPWTVTFEKAKLMRSVTTASPKIYRIYATGRYGSTETTIETVLDFNKTIRRLPSEDAIEEEESDPDVLKELKAARREQLKEIPKGRVLFWREY